MVPRAWENQVDYEKLGRKSWDELTEVERYLLETQHTLRGLSSNSDSEDFDYKEGEYDDNDASIDSEDNSIEDSDEDDEENSVSDEAIEEGEGVYDDNIVNDGHDSKDGNQSKEEDDESEDSVEENSGDSEEDKSIKTHESLPEEEDTLQEPSETTHHYNYRRRIGGRAARVWNTRQYQYYHLSVHYLINVYVKLRSKIDI